MSNRVLTQEAVTAKLEEKLLLAKPSLKGLAYLLRRQDLWPKDFYWDWGYAEDCGMGLALKYWGLQPFPSYRSAVGMHFGLGAHAVLDTFCTRKPIAWWERWCTNRNPTPTEIARYIEKRLLKGDQT